MIDQYTDWEPLAPSQIQAAKEFEHVIKTKLAKT